MLIIPSDPNINYVAVTLILVGIFLFLSGINVIKIEKVTVSRGFKTWFVGLLLVVSGVFLFAPKNLLSEAKIPAQNETDFKIPPNTNMVNQTQDNSENKLTIYKTGTIQSQVYIYNPPSKILNKVNGRSTVCTINSNSKIYIDKTPIVGVNGGYWYKTNICGNIGYVYQSDIAPSLRKNHHIARVFDPPSNVRTKPKNKASIKCTLKKKTSINIFGTGIPNSTGGAWFLTDVCKGNTYIHDSQFKIKY